MTPQSQLHSPPIICEADEKANATSPSKPPTSVEGHGADSAKRKEDESPDDIDGEDAIAFTIIDWDKPGPDPRNPMDWSMARKWTIIALVTGITLIP